MIKFTLFIIPLMLLHAFGEESPRLNDTLPDFSLIDIRGNTHTLYQYRDKIVMLYTFGYG